MSDTTTPAADAVDEAVEAPAENTPEAALTQADVDRIVKERLARERAKFADYDQLKEAAAKLAEIEDSQKSELQKAQEQAQAAAAELEALRTQLREQSIKSAVMNAAATAGAINPAQVLRLIDLDGIEPGEDGSVDLGTRVSDFLAENPHLVKDSTPSLPSAPGTSTTNGAVKPLTAEEIEKIDAKDLAADPSLLARVIEARNAMR